jgi:hypothetical protein
MPQSSPIARRAILLVSCAALLAGCGSNAPVIPEGPRERTFAGRLDVQSADSVGGLFHLTTVVSGGPFGTRTRESLSLQSLRIWSATPLWAQSAPGIATGSLVTNNGVTVPLSGTYSGGSFQVMGGGYAIAASLNPAGSLSGSGTAPSGAEGTVSPLYPPTSAPPPSNATGSYYGTFEMSTNLRSRNTTPSGSLIGVCFFPVRITGNLVMHVTQASQSSQVTGHLDMRWSERRAGPGTCPPAATHNVDDYYGIDFDGVVTGLHPVRTHSGPAGPSGAGRLSRTQGFSGTVSGSTVIGTVFLMMDFSTPVSEGMHYEVFGPAPSAAVTLTRR